MGKIHKSHSDETGDYFVFNCPGCESSHMIRVTPDPEKGWKFNGDFEWPTIYPSILVNGDLSCPACPKCHSYVTDGNIQFLKDTTHKLAGQTVPLNEF